MFNLIVSALTQGKVNPSVTALFSSLKKARPDLAEGLAAYVTSGAGTTVMAMSPAEWAMVHAEVVRRWSPGIRALEIPG